MPKREEDKLVPEQTDTALRGARESRGIDLDNSSAWTFNGGVSIAKVIGINLSAQTGYDEGAEVSYYVTASSGPWICGVKNNPGGVHPPPGLIVAH